MGYHVELLGCDVSPLQATVLNSVRLPEQFFSTHKFFYWVGRVRSFLSKNTMQWLWPGLKPTLFNLESGVLAIGHMGSSIHPKCVESTNFVVDKFN